MNISRAYPPLLSLLMLVSFSACQRNSGQQPEANNNSTTPPPTTTTPNTITEDSTNADNDTSFFVVMDDTIKKADGPPSSSHVKPTSDITHPINEADIRFKVFVMANGTYGYDVFQNGKVIINQGSIPGQAGDQGFATHSQATSAATLVKKKLVAGKVPPTLSQKELQQIMNE